MVLNVEHIKVEERGQNVLLEVLKDDIRGHYHVMPFRRDCNRLKLSFWCLTGLDKYQLLEKARNLIRIDLWV